MYKLMIVEDEEIVRDGMVNLIDFAALGYQVVAACENGREALERFYQVLPDVVLTDICMAEMDGFEFINHVYSEQLHTKFIIITGHDDFSYMKQALKYKVTDYILKPVIARELKGLLSDVKTNLDRELQELVDLNSMKSDSLRSAFLKRQNFFNKIVGIRLEDDVIASQAAEIGVTFVSPFHCVLVFDCPDRESAVASQGLAGEDQLTFMIFNVTEEFALLQDQRHVFTDYYGRTLALLCGESEKGLSASGKKLAAEVVGYFKKTFGIRLSARMGSARSGLSQINKSFEQAVSLFLVECPDELVYYPEWEKKRSGVSFPAVRFSELLFDAIAGEDAPRTDGIPYGGLSDTVLSMFEPERVMSMDFENLKNHVRIVANLLCEKFGAMDVEIAAFDPAAESADLLKEKFSGWLSEVRETLKAQTSTKLKLMNKVFLTIEERYRDFEFSGEDVTKSIAISTSYFSSLFKAVTGTTFTKYLNAYRIERAKELLRYTDKNVSEIGESVGYLSSAYFGLVFKNATGLTPNAYKKKFKQAI